MKHLFSSVIALIFLFLFLPFFAEAQSVNNAPFALPTSLDDVIQKLPQPLTDFINSLHRLSNSGFATAPHVPVYGMPYAFPAMPQDANPGTFYNFVHQLILFVGGFLVVILRVIASIIESVISWFGRI